MIVAMSWPWVGLILGSGALLLISSLAHKSLRVWALLKDREHAKGGK